MNAQTSDRSPKPLSSTSPITVGLMVIIVGGLGWITREISTLRTDMEHDMREHYVTRELFEARMSSLDRQIEDLRQEVRRK